MLWHDSSSLGIAYQTLPTKKKKKGWKGGGGHLNKFFKIKFSIKKRHELVGVIYFAMLAKCRATTSLEFF